MIAVALDTNIVAYAENTNGEARRDQVVALIARLAPESTYLPAQVLGELFHLLVKKARWKRDAAERAVLSWGDAFPIIDTSASVLLLALTLARDHQFGPWDAVVLASAADAGCRVLLSEDLQDGFSWSGVTVVNPFAARPHPLLARLG